MTHCYRTGCHGHEQTPLAFHGMIVPSGSTAGRHKAEQRSENLGGVLVVNPLHLSVSRYKRAPCIEKILPGLVAVANHPGIGPLVERIGRVQYYSPIRVALGQRIGLGVADDASCSATTSDRLRSHRILSGDSHEFGLRKD